MTSQLTITWADEPLALVPLTTQDGDRLTAEQQQRDTDRAASEQRQTQFTTVTT